MATRVRQELVDDVDGTDAIDTFSFSFEGVDYAIDLNEVHAKELDADLEKWIQYARRIGGNKRKARGATKAVAVSNGTSPTKGKTAEIREWARANGWPDLATHGRVPVAVEEAWLQANAGQ